jgi:hypothetical protein
MNRIGIKGFSKRQMGAFPTNVHVVCHHPGCAFMVIMDPVAYKITSLDSQFEFFKRIFIKRVMHRYNEQNPDAKISLILLSVAGHSSMRWEMLGTPDIPIHDALHVISTLTFRVQRSKRYQRQQRI